jgi:hypothetical protein
MALAISFIFSLPAGAFFTTLAVMIEKTTPAIPTSVHINGKL